MLVVWKEHWCLSMVRPLECCGHAFWFGVWLKGHVWQLLRNVVGTYKNHGSCVLVTPCCLSFLSQLLPDILRPRAWQGLSEGDLGFCELGQPELCTSRLIWEGREETNIEESVGTWSKWVLSQQRGCLKITQRDSLFFPSARPEWGISDSLTPNHVLLPYSVCVEWPTSPQKFRSDWQSRGKD